MKKFLLASVMILGITAISFGQKTMKMKSGVMMVDGKVMMCKAGKCTPLMHEYTCTDKCKIAPDGTLTKPDGSTMKLMNGYEIAKDGKMTMIPHGQSGHVCTKECPMAGKM